MTATVRNPPTGLSLWPLVGVVADRLQCRRPLSAVDLGMDRDMLVVQVGPAVPYRLLLLETEPTGLVRVTMWQANGRIKVVADEKAMSDLVPDVLQRWATEFGLS